MAAFWILIPALLAQGSIEGPTLGVIWDAEAKAVRTVAGIPGSAIIGSKFDSPVALRSAVSIGDAALALSEDGRVYRLEDARWTPENLPEGAKRISLSGGGAAAILYPGGVVRMLSRGSAPRELKLEFEDPLLAVSDDGSLLLAASGREVWVVNQAGNRWKHEFAGQVRDVLFSGNSSDALIGTASGLWLLRDTAGPGETRLLWEGDAAHVNTAKGGRIALAARSSQSAVTAVEIETGLVQTIETAVEAAALFRLGSGDVFRITGEDAGTHWILDLRGDGARTFFLPRNTEPKE